MSWTVVAAVMAALVLLSLLAAALLARVLWRRLRELGRGVQDAAGRVAALSDPAAALPQRGPDVRPGAT